MATKENSKLQKKIDQISRSVFLDAKGKPKSSDFLYAFCMAILFLLIYFGIYFGWYALLNRFEALVCQNAILNALEVFFLPAVVGTLPCFGLSLLFKKKKGLPFLSFVILLALHIFVCIAFIFMSLGEDFWSFYHAFLTMMGYQGFLICLCGGIPTYLIYRKWAYEEALKKLEQKKQEQNRPSYYNT